MLDDGITGRPSIDERHGIQRDTDSDEVEDFVDECTKQRNTNRQPCPFRIFIVDLVPFQSG